MIEYEYMYIVLVLLLDRTVCTIRVGLSTYEIINFPYIDVLDVACKNAKIFYIFDWHIN